MAETDAPPSTEDVAQANDAKTQPLSGAELEQAIRRQVEHYFSKENLARDHYLLTLMDGQRFVPLDLIANFGRVKQLTEDTGLIARALEGSAVCTLDETRTKVRPSAKAAQRTTIILRDTPEGTTLEEVQELWKSSSFKGVTEIRPDIAGCWFVSMETEEEARDAVMWVRQQKLGGEPVKARIKTESITPSVFFVPPPQQVMYAPPAGAYGMGAWAADAGQYYGADGQDARQGMGERAGDGRRRAGDRTRKSGKGGTNAQGQREGDNRRTKRSNRKHGSGTSGGTPPKKAQEFKLGATHFPPLPKKHGSDGPGYSGEFQQYKKMDFIAAIKGAQDAKPDLPAVAVVQEKPNDTIESAGDAPASQEPGEASATSGSAEAEPAVGHATESAGESAGTAAAKEPSTEGAPAVQEAPSAVAEAAAPAKQTWAQKLKASK